MGQSEVIHTIAAAALAGHVPVDNSLRIDGAHIVASDDRRRWWREMLLEHRCVDTPSSGPGPGFERHLQMWPAEIGTATKFIKHVGTSRQKRVPSYTSRFCGFRRPRTGVPRVRALGDAACGSLQFRCAVGHQPVSATIKRHVLKGVGLHHTAHVEASRGTCAGISPRACVTQQGTAYLVMFHRCFINRHSALNIGFDCDG